MHLNKYIKIFNNNYSNINKITKFRSKLLFMTAIANNNQSKELLSAITRFKLNNLDKSLKIPCSLFLANDNNND